MNVERLEYIAKWLENGAIHITEDGHKYGFDMTCWMDPYSSTDPEHCPWNPAECGTVMCIGGAAEQFFGGGEETPARDLLGLSEDQEWDLFYPWNTDGFSVWKDGYDSLTPERAATVIRHLIKTGKVDWSLQPAEAA